MHQRKAVVAAFLVLEPTCFLATDCSTSRCSLSPIILELSRSILTASLWNTVLYCTVLY